MATGSNVDREGSRGNEQVAEGQVYNQDIAGWSEGPEPATNTGLNHLENLILDIIGALG